MTHSELLTIYRTPYAMFRKAGIPYTTANRWYHAGVVKDWRCWRTLVQVAKAEGWLEGDTDAMLAGLAKDVTAGEK